MPRLTTEMDALGALAEHPSVEGALDAVRELLGMEIAYVARFDDDVQVFERLRGDPTGFGVAEGTRLPMDDTICIHVLGGHLPHVSPDLRADPFGATLPIVHAAAVAAYASVPLHRSDGSLYGTLCCASHTAQGLDQRDEQFLTILARLIGSELERAQLAEQSRLAQVRAASSLALIAAMEARDQYTSDHSIAVVRHAARVARRLGLTAESVADVEQVALLHDIGKLAIPDAILHHPGPLDADQWEVMRTHSIVSEQIVTSIPGLAHLATAVRAEHERWDGTGYPDGLQGEQIPMPSRIALACDAYHAMTSDRPYRQRLERDVAIEELRHGAGTQFDPAVVGALLATLGRGTSRKVV